MGRNSSIPGTAVVMAQSFSNMSSASSRSAGMSFSSQKSKILLIPMPSSMTFAIMGPTASGAGSPYFSTRSVSLSRREHRMREPQNATALAPARSANRITDSATTDSSSIDSRTEPSASHVTQPCTKTPGMGAPASFPSTTSAHGPRDLPVARTVGTPAAAALASAASTRRVSCWSELSSVPSTSVTMSFTSSLPDAGFPDAHSPSLEPAAASTTRVDVEVEVPAAGVPGTEPPGTNDSSSAVAAASFASTVFRTPRTTRLLPTRRAPAPMPAGMRSCLPAASRVGLARARRTGTSPRGAAENRIPVCAGGSRLE